MSAHHTSPFKHACIVGIASLCISHQALATTTSDTSKAVITVSNTWVKFISDMAYQTSTWLTQALHYIESTPHSAGHQAGRAIQQQLNLTTVKQLAGATDRPDANINISAATQTFTNAFLYPLLDPNTSTGTPQFQGKSKVTTQRQACVALGEQHYRLTLKDTSLQAQTKAGLKLELLAKRCQSDIHAALQKSQSSGSLAPTSQKSSTESMNDKVHAAQSTNPPPGTACSTASANELIKAIGSWWRGMDQRGLTFQPPAVQYFEQFKNPYSGNKHGLSGKVLVVRLKKMMPHLTSVNRTLRAAFAMQIYNQLNHESLPTCLPQGLAYHSSPSNQVGKLTLSPQSMSADLILGRNSLIGRPGAGACTVKTASATGSPVPDLTPYARSYLLLLEHSADMGHLDAPSVPVGRDQIISNGDITTLEKGIDKVKKRNAVKSFRIKQGAKVDQLIEQYLNLAKGTAAVRNLALSNLYHIYGLRSVSTATTLPMATTRGIAQTKAQCTPQEVAHYSATWRMQPTWLAQVQTATPANVNRQMLLLLAEIRYQLYLNNQEQQRMLATLSMMQFAHTKGSAETLKSMKGKIKHAVDDYVKGQASPKNMSAS